MKVTALQGDTLDQLCHRHYGKTKGVTEAVLSANPGLSGRIFLDAGQVVEMPDIDTQSAQEMVQLWS
ncbi:tail protein X [Citrobacter braakii]|uniref:tail protein X n=1 Tax=Citrobacter braakii TaxID=57706 RepID=UPI0039791B9E